MSFMFKKKDKLVSEVSCVFTAKYIIALFEPAQGPKSLYAVDVCLPFNMCIFDFLLLGP